MSEEKNEEMEEETIDVETADSGAVTEETDLPEDDAAGGEPGENGDGQAEQTPEEAASGNEDSDNDDLKNESKGGVREKKRRKKDKKDEKIEELNDRLLRNMAEFENFRNRSEKEKSAMFDIGARSVIEKILPVVDNFERGLGAVPDEEKDSAFVKGMEAIYKQISTMFEEIGVVPIEAVGKEFDPNLHNAVMHDEDDTMEANTVSEEFQKGYLYKDSVVRHSMVKVVN